MARGKGGLGRGLESLFEDASPIFESDAKVETLPLREIEPDPDQPRKTFDQQALGELAAMTPAQDGVYTQEQLADLPFTEAYLLPEAYDGGLPGLTQRLVLLFSDFEKDGQLRVLLYADTAAGAAAAAYPVDDLVYTMTILFWTLLCLDLYRVSYFLTRRDRLNRRVLKPITDMAETAATLSAGGPPT